MPTSKQFTKFLFIGGINTFLTLLLYQAINIFFPYWIAYSAAFATGVLISFSANSRFSFNTKMTSKKLWRYCFFYFASYILGLILSITGVTYFGIDDKLIPFLVVPLMLPFNFIGTKVILEKTYGN